MTPAEQKAFDSMREALEKLLRQHNSLLADCDKLGGDAVTQARDALSAAKAVSEDKRQSVTITSVKMVGGVAPEAELMRQATEQLEGMGFRVEHPKAVQPQAQGEDKLRETVATVLEGWTIPDAVRKMLETAYWSHPQASEPAPSTAPAYEFKKPDDTEGGAL